MQPLLVQLGHLTGKGMISSYAVQVCLTDGETWRFYFFCVDAKDICIVECGSWEQAVDYILTTLPTIGGRIKLRTSSRLL